LSQAENEADGPASFAAVEGIIRTDSSGGFEVVDDSRPRNDSRPVCFALWPWNFQILADLLCQKVVDLSVAGNCRSLAGRTVDIDAVIPAFT
jgi:hypothetical protein